MKHRPERSGLGRREGISGRLLTANKWCAFRPIQGARRIIAVQPAVLAESGRADGLFGVGLRPQGIPLSWREGFSATSPPGRKHALSAARLPDLQPLTRRVQATSPMISPEIAFSASRAAQPSP
ncbi:hypothetical protein EIB18_04580 [Caulobacter vibrioides]|uniref:Uncharacterized protein n=2 Tax=Caulobacter vibrioides TaxID=155892 RepID=Q9A9V8_CAUVC|nr:hypothetical protein [Caulobacter vibrioides]YP_002516269.1 hypothetical protein CCNA_00896 [Caulobacter vibrioides NA1000]QBQ56962.1 hypothetical protein EUX21_00880 [synthetic Caulobacter sp. 'ethensis']AAK22838.1 hypothetical protein CC_0853 [Caulobacter vibrioides CB15]ACL94361.1 hypothetical protein CCNA_00896 [Caulobacter vibrioides NA1000]ATC27693.1 hypothetical protein CA607_04530 [Caulobacter vibrioides]AZH12058.1 hypothetical protein EIB18_04580 [Caulobacter vibrioides]